MGVKPRTDEKNVEHAPLYAPQDTIKLEISTSHPHQTTKEKRDEHEIRISQLVANSVAKQPDERGRNKKAGHD